MAGHIKRRTRRDKTTDKVVGHTWRARYPDPSHGGRKEIERNFATKREAERWLNEQKVAVQRGTHVDPADHERQFKDVVEAWRGTWLELEPKTKAGYDSILNKHVLPRWSEARIGAVSTEAIQNWVNELAGKLTPKTVRHIYGVLRSIMKMAVQRRYITASPCDAVSLPRLGSARKEMLSLTAVEVAALAEAIGPHDRVMVYTAAYGGLRAGELDALRRRDVDLLHSKLSVVYALKEINSTSDNIAPEDKGLIFGPTKNGKPRVVGIPRFLRDMLAAHIEEGHPPTPEGYPAVGKDGRLRWTHDPNDPDRLLFVSHEGGPIRHGNFYRRTFKPTVQRRHCGDCGSTVRKDVECCPKCESETLAYLLPAEKRALRFHDLRHTCASLLIAADAHPKAIQEHLGHRDIQTTFNVYGHLLPSAHEALAAALDSAYAGSNGASSVPHIGKVAV